ncbi:MAG: Flp family type IVb pilin [Actinomycetota bacterium]|jgi:pilus assembly protein Flp/PilA|nr:Flp family type IVb pilin [Actinomycetota bacterium]
MQFANMCWAYCQAVVRTRIKDERGASLVEYALLVALIAVICIGAVTLIGEGANKTLSKAGGSLNK